jgi:hypothetical protein
MLLHQQQQQLLLMMMIKKQQTMPAIVVVVSTAVAEEKARVRPRTAIAEAVADEKAKVVQADKVRLNGIPPLATATVVPNLTVPPNNDNNIHIRNAPSKPRIASSPLLPLTTTVIININ